MNGSFYKGLIHSYRKSLIFLTKINKMNDTTRMLERFIAKKVYDNENIDNVNSSNGDSLRSQKKTQDCQRLNLVSLLIGTPVTLICWYGNFISKNINRANN